MWKKVTSLRLLRQETTVSLLKGVSDSCKPKVKKHLYLLWILGKRTSQGLSSLLQLVLKMLELQKILLNLHLSSHFWQDRRCSNSLPGSSGFVVPFWKLRWLTAHPEAVNCSHYGLVFRELRVCSGGEGTNGPRDTPWPCTAVPQAKMTPQGKSQHFINRPIQ